MISEELERIELEEIDTLIISDIHLGSEVSRSKQLLDVINQFNFKRLILNGDVFDDLNFKRLSKSDWKFLSFIRKISGHKVDCHITWVIGNHDGVAEILSHLLGIEVLEEYQWEYNGKQYLAIHGHQFDSFITENPRLTDIASYLYLLLQKVDSNNQQLSRWVKRTSKKWLQLSESSADLAIDYARKKNAHFIFCGHTHIPLIKENLGVLYYNSGCWTDRPSHYITICSRNGIQLRECS
jgi:UDP-2,3-diacylglucosamine pyrophosphatase LpxH